MGEILYYLVFSEKSVEELRAVYAVSSYARSLYEAKNPHIGDARWKTDGMYRHIS
ncbi:hypothetical protein [Sporofaciens sp. JLR.KK001]|uniref:hypothetical protein n=1 Tax=Sporofaciens sp. JLR.KK001 TaxID=3112621 RepID=UPI002FEF5451